jgi:hypothetical protein
MVLVLCHGVIIPLVPWDFRWRILDFSKLSLSVRPSGSPWTCWRKRQNGCQESHAARRGRRGSRWGCWGWRGFAAEVASRLELSGIDRRVPEAQTGQCDFDFGSRSMVVKRSAYRTVDTAFAFSRGIRCLELLQTRCQSLPDEIWAVKPETTLPSSLKLTVVDGPRDRTAGDAAVI